MTLQDFANSSIWNQQGLSKIETFVTIEGEQACCARAQTLVEVSDGIYSYSHTASVPGSRAETRTPWDGQGTFSIDQLYPNFKVPVEATLTNWSNPPYTPDAYNVNFSLSFKVTATVGCTGDALDTAVCADLCTLTDEAIATCTNAYLDFCTPEKLVESTNCQTFVENVIQKQGPIARLDDSLRKYCDSDYGGKYGGFHDLFYTDGVPEIDQQVCACHMSDTRYQQFQEQVNSQFEWISSLYTQVDLCYVPQCISSRYQAVPIPKGGCKMPQCLQINAINNNGTFSGNVDQSASCNISGGGNVPGWLVILIIVIIIILLAVVYVIST
jgi:hypothetical protein